MTARARSKNRLLLGWLALFSLCLLLRNAALAAEGVREGLRLCAERVIPSLFPFTVLAELLLRSGVAQRLPEPLTRPLGRLLALPPAGVLAIVLGLLCGFPVGVRCAVTAYERGSLTKNEAERALAASSIPSAAFVTGMVAPHVGQARGVALLLLLPAGALLGGILLKSTAKKPKKEVSTPLRAVPQKATKGASLLSESIAASLGAMLSISAYVVFFSVLCGALSAILARVGCPAWGKALVFCTLELSGGVASATALPSPASAILAGAALGWSGLSVHAQVLSITSSHDLNLRPYLAVKALQTALCTLAMLVG